MEEKDNRVRVNLLGPKDLDISYFCGSGAGGQARNKVASGVQMKHPESGAIGRACDTRSQDQNKRAAFNRMLKTPKMKFWLTKKVYEVKQGEALETTIERETTDQNMKYEIKDEAGKWTEVGPEYFKTEQAQAV